MTIISLLILLLIAGVCGAIGQAIAGFSRGGILVSIAIGFIGALLGMWISSTPRLPAGQTHYKVKRNQALIDTLILQAKSKAV